MVMELFPFFSRNLISILILIIMKLIQNSKTHENCEWSCSEVRREEGVLVGIVYIFLLVFIIFDKGVYKWRYSKNKTSIPTPPEWLPIQNCFSNLQSRSSVDHHLRCHFLGNVLKCSPKKAGNFEFEKFNQAELHIFRIISIWCISLGPATIKSLLDNNCHHFQLTINLLQEFPNNENCDKRKAVNLLCFSWHQKE